MTFWRGLRSRLSHALVQGARQSKEKNPPRTEVSELRTMFICLQGTSKNRRFPPPRKRLELRRLPSHCRSCG
jgi:hypothetical protein